MRLIDFDKLVETVKGCSDRWTLPQREGAELMLDIAEYLAEEQEDAVPVVRCKDCKHYADAKPNAKGFLICPTSGMEIREDDYCSYRERGEEADENA